MFALIYSLNPFLIMVSGLLVVVSFLIKVEIHQRSLKWLGFSFYLCGVLVYFRETIIPWLANSHDWRWSIGSGDYYSITALSATVYILLLSFRSSRLIERTNKEEDQALLIKKRLDDLQLSLENLGHNTTGNKAIFEALNRNLQLLDRAKKPAHLYYVNRIFNYLFDDIIEDYLVGTLAQKSESFVAKIYEIRYNISLLYRSKQRGKYPGESLILLVFTTCTILVTIGTMPAGGVPGDSIMPGWNGVIIDVVAFLFASAICFLAINLVNLGDYRATSTFQLLKEESKLSNQTLRIKSATIIASTLLIPVIYIWLLYAKWIM